MKQDLKQHILSVMDSHGVDVVVFTTDGQVFLKEKEQAAKHHARLNKLQVRTVTRDELVPDESKVQKKEKVNTGNQTDDNDSEQESKTTDIENALNTNLDSFLEKENESNIELIPEKVEQNTATIKKDNK